MLIHVARGCADTCSTRMASVELGVEPGHHRCPRWSSTTTAGRWCAHRGCADAAAPMMEQRRDVGEGHKALYDGYSPTRPLDRVGVADETDIGVEGNVEMGRLVAWPLYSVAE